MRLSQWFWSFPVLWITFFQRVSHRISVRFAFEIKNALVDRDAAARIHILSTPEYFHSSNCISSSLRTCNISQRRKKDRCVAITSSLSLLVECQDRNQETGASPDNFDRREWHYANVCESLVKSRWWQFIDIVFCDANYAWFDRQVPVSQAQREIIQYSSILKKQRNIATFIRLIDDCFYLRWIMLALFIRNSLVEIWLFDPRQRTSVDSLTFCHWQETTHRKNFTLCINL